jgi:mRNA interferase RelE/StbE
MWSASLAWRIEFTEPAKKQLAKLDRTVAKRIASYLRERVAGDADPRTVGKPLKGELREYWRYRVGDWRVICSIEDERLVVLVLHLAHRREVYR